MRKLLLAASLAATAWLTACAGNPFNGAGIAPGTTRDGVVARMGQPQRVVRLASGERLQYSLQPYGQYAWMVDLDASGRVTSARQVLTEAGFNRIQPGWTRQQVQDEFGRPAWVDGVASWDGAIWTYRWKDVQNSDMFYYVYFDRGGVVRRAHPGMEFINAPNDRN
jgi:hypothetical protein